MRLVTTTSLEQPNQTDPRHDYYYRSLTTKKLLLAFEAYLKTVMLNASQTSRLIVYQSLQSLDLQVLK
jgi:hypothetical protein